ncbi:hypothetical protein BS78_09G129300 [Paspalum vaginatum]|nr:hypothetical protein BS78_09G129300 [Paspalum vaginatum]
MVVSGDAAAPCRPRSARYADKGYPNYAEADGRRARLWKNKGGVGGRAKKPEARVVRKRGREPASEGPASAAGKVPPAILQDEEAVAQEQGRKRRVTGAAAAGEVFPVIEHDDQGEEMASTGGGGDELGDAGGGGGKSWRLRVKETLRAFSSNYLHCVQEEQRRAEVAKKELKASRALKRQNRNSQENGSYQEAKRPSRRPDLKALTKMQECGAVLFREKRIGHLPGIDVGDQFYSRAEMVALGIHSHWLNGIDYMGMKYQDQKGCEGFTFPLATCIVLSGVYEDDLDNANEIIYTGQGGNNWLGDRHKKTEQTLLRGNLALKNSKDNGNPIRVIRGHIEKSSYSGKIYTYDGLYKVVDYWPEKGVQGPLVFKYRMRRLEGQPPLTTSQVLFTRGDVPMLISELPGLVCGDISNGQENFPIPATNLVDNPPVPPSGFVYSKSLQIPDNIKIPVDGIGCNCSGDCSNSKHCLCAKRNGSDLPYVSKRRKRAQRNNSNENSVGRLVEPKAVVYECGTNCTCHCNCVNRTSQQGLKYRLEVFKTESKGWGVRTWDTILPGALICEYTGILRRTTEVEGLLENNYIFDIDCLQTIKGLDGREELSYDYGYHLDSVTGEDGNIVKLACHCGAADCRKRLY